MKKLFNVTRGFTIGSLIIVWVSLFFAFLAPSVLGGVFGTEMNEILALRIGKVGSGFAIFLSLLTFIIIRFNPNFKFNKSSVKDELEDSTDEYDKLDAEFNSTPNEEEKIVENTEDSVQEPKVIAVEENAIQASIEVSKK